MQFHSLLNLTNIDTDEILQKETKIPKLVVLESTFTNIPELHSPYFLLQRTRRCSVPCSFVSQSTTGEWFTQNGYDHLWIPDEHVPHLRRRANVILSSVNASRQVHGNLEKSRYLFLSELGGTVTAYAPYSSSHSTDMNMFPERQSSKENEQCATNYLRFLATTSLLCEVGSIDYVSKLFQSSLEDFPCHLCLEL
jgi:hypothetical protein